MIRKLQIRREGTRVLLLADGSLVASVTWQQADEMARLLRSAARMSEALEKTPEIARDHAILLRAGIPMGLTNDPRTREEAAKIAAWDRDLRRYMPGGIKSAEHFGTPTIHRHPTRASA